MPTDATAPNGPAESSRCTECPNPAPGPLRRGLCHRCYHRHYWRHRHHGTPLPSQPTRRPVAELVTDADALRSRGLTTTEQAAQLGVSASRLSHARTEHRRQRAA